MIKVEDLTKKYSGVVAVNGLNFSVGTGDVVGFLGPNGAGKSTTMRILAGYIPATSGRVSVAGFDIFQESLEARRRIGYLPENVPLYPEMRVSEYLRYRADLKGVKPRFIRSRVADAVEQCGLQDMFVRIIGNLSKGYRQRVGLADTLVHEPDILILDEPTIGLDPTQIRQVRELIRTLSKRHTILLSTHILSEVEAICQRVLIIARGEIQASGTVDSLVGGMRAAGQSVVEWKGPDEARTRKELETLPGVREVVVRPLDDGWIGGSVRVEAGGDVREDIFRMATTNGWSVRQLSQRRITLEDVFVEVTEV